jgi:hypothetical protein
VHGKTVVAPLILLGLLCTAAWCGSTAREEVLVLARPGTFLLPSGQMEVSPSQVRCSPSVMDALGALGVQEIRIAMPRFNRADTLSKTPGGGIARLPDLSNLFTLRLPAEADMGFRGHNT